MLVSGVSRWSWDLKFQNFVFWPKIKKISSHSDEFDKILEISTSLTDNLYPLTDLVYLLSANFLLTRYHEFMVLCITVSFLLLALLKMSTEKVPKSDCIMLRVFEKSPNL